MKTPDTLREEWRGTEMYKMLLACWGKGGKTINGDTEDWWLSKCTSLYNAGREDEKEKCIAEVKRIANLYRKAKFGLDDEILNHILSALNQIK